MLFTVVYVNDFFLGAVYWLKYKKKNHLLGNVEDQCLFFLSFEDDYRGNCSTRSRDELVTFGIFMVQKVKSSLRNDAMWAAAADGPRCSVVICVFAQRGDCQNTWSKEMRLPPLFNPSIVGGHCVHWHRACIRAVCMCGRDIWRWKGFWEENLADVGLATSRRIIIQKGAIF